MFGFLITIHDEDGNEADVYFRTSKRGAKEIEKLIKERFNEWYEEEAKEE
jgi:hypothetical protein